MWQYNEKLKLYECKITTEFGQDVIYCRDLAQAETTLKAWANHIETLRQGKKTTPIYNALKGA